ncbi:MAG: glycerol-3-phosphate dehydrogenase (NAD(P)+) [Nitriliruptoraceae bacterium]|jgi:glycerol-3-phosphate dehydrogenase (NAD(P)+)
MTKLAVMGSGSWGTAFGALAVTAGSETVLWARRPEVAAEVRDCNTNAAYLPDVALPPLLHATADPTEALAGADVVVVAVPSTGVAEQLEAWGDQIGPDATLVSLIKGVDVQTRRFGSQTIAGTLDIDPSRVVVVSGPNLARECAKGYPAATVAAGQDQARTAQVQAAVMCPTFRVYTSPDRIGVEVGGAVKNVLAIASGMAFGRGFGDNTTAMVITRGLAEMMRLGVALGGDTLTFSGLAGVGDLIATCTSTQSRNQTVGRRLGAGETLDDIISDMNMVAEGVKSSKAILALAEEAGVEMPISEAVVSVLHHGVEIDTMTAGLLARRAKPEHYGLD